MTVWRQWHPWIHAGCRSTENTHYRVDAPAQAAIYALTISHQMNEHRHDQTSMYTLQQAHATCYEIEPSVANALSRMFQHQTRDLHMPERFLQAKCSKHSQNPSRNPRCLQRTARTNPMRQQTGAPPHLPLRIQAHF